MIGILGARNILLADRAYGSDKLCMTLADRGGWAIVKPMLNRTKVPAFSRFLSRWRNAVERFFRRSNTTGASQTRYDKTPEN